MAAITIQRALTCSPRAVAMIAKAIAPAIPTRTQGPCDRRVLVMAFPIPVRLLIVNDYAPARQVWEAGAAVLILAEGVSPKSHTGLETACAAILGWPSLIQHRNGGAREAFE